MSHEDHITKILFLQAVYLSKWKYLITARNAFFPSFKNKKPFALTYSKNETTQCILQKI